VEPEWTKTAIDATSEIIIRLVAWLLPKQVQRREAGKERREIAHKLFGVLARAYVVPGCENPQFAPSVHPYDREALKAVRDILHRFFKEGRQEGRLDISGLPDLNFDICSIGGPVSHKFTKFAMGYNQAGKLEAPTLPFVYDLAGAESSNVRVVHKYRNTTWRPPNWYLINARTRKPDFGKPVVGNEGFLKTDFLTLVVAPNTFTKRAFEEGKKHLMIAGAHGIANTAVRYVFGKKVLEVIREKSQKADYFQVILKVPKISWKKEHQVAVFEEKLEPEVEVFPIDLEYFVKRRNWDAWKQWS
jgi:hypothetical protein